MNYGKDKQVALDASERGVRTFHRYFEWAALLFAASTLIVFAARLAESFVLGWFFPLLLTCVLSYYAADLISGLVHWACDRYGSARTPFLGEHFIEPFREHHRDPQAIAQRGFVETNGNTAIALSPILILVQIELPMSGPNDNLFLHAFVISLCVWLIATNQFHKLAHVPRAETSRLTRWLQNKHLILPGSHHHQHHQAAFDRHYCITTGQLDPVLEKLEFWTRLQTAITHVSRKWSEIRAPQ
jgi:hypothetical protein